MSIRLFIRVTAFLPMISFATIAMAAELGSGHFSVREVVAEALAQNPEIQAMRERSRAVREMPVQAGALDDPEFKVELFNYPERLNPDASSNTIFGLSQRFPYPGKRGLKKSLAFKDGEVAQAQVQEKEREIAVQVKIAYYDLLLAHKAIGFHSQQIDVLKNIVEIANARFRTGKGAQVDVLKANVELSKLFNQLPVLEQQRDSATAKLNFLMNRPPDSSLGAPQEPAGMSDQPSYQELRRLALQHRPELRIFSVEAARGQTAIALAQKQYYPDFNVMVERFQNFGARDGFGGMVVMSMPFSFWTKAKYDAGVREAKARHESAKAAFHALENQVGYEVKDLLVKWETSQKVMGLYKTTIIPQARQTMESARVNYQAGKVEFLTLLDAERALRDFQLEYYRAQAAVEQRKAELERAVGIDLNGQS